MVRVVVIRDADSRRSETPGGIMTTFASPTQGGATRSVWRVDVKAGGQGPLHRIDSEQVWTWVTGKAVVELGEERFEVGSGDTVVMPGGTPRRVLADPATGYTAVVAGSPGARAVTADGTDHGVPPWII
jgi:quercetin dioxygenase-like cupin family protein